MTSGLCQMITFDTVLKYTLVFITSFFKYMGGVVLAIVYRFSFWEQFLTTFLGGSCGILFFAYLEEKVKEWWRRKRGGTGKPASRRQVKEWQKQLWEWVGLVGVAFLTPPLFGPPIGTTIAIVFGTPPKKILFYYVPSFLFWSLLFSLTHEIEYESLLRRLFSSV